MRPDLLYAQAAVDWAVSHFPSIEKRLNSWIELNVSVGFEKLDPDVPNDLIVTIEKEPLPLSFNVEAGAYINTIRSSLDILATALAYRYSIPKPEDAYFPVAPSKAVFLSGGYKGAKFVQGLPTTERQIIESLEPYKGGNKTLWPLHHLDIMRKHRRLLSLEPGAGTFSIMGWGLSQYFTPIQGGWMRAHDKTVLGLIDKGAPKPKIQFTGYIGFDEPELGRRMPVVAALRDFASLADSIIKLFDDPGFTDAGTPRAWL